MDCTRKGKELDAVTNQQAIRVVQEIVRENRENGELEGILNRHRVSALKRLIRIKSPGILVGPKQMPLFIIKTEVYLP
jgi:hypothetical protein